MNNFCRKNDGCVKKLSNSPLACYQGRIYNLPFYMNLIQRIIM